MAEKAVPFDNLVFRNVRGQAEKPSEALAEACRAWANGAYFKARDLGEDARYGGSRRAQNLSALTLAECVENKGRYRHSVPSTDRKNML